MINIDKIRSKESKSVVRIAISEKKMSNLEMIYLDVIKFPEALIRLKMMILTKIDQ